MKSIHILSLVSLFFVSATTSAQVYINGQLYQGIDLHQLQLQYGEPIPPGNYWLMQNGNWGYVGSNQVQGNFFTDNHGNGVVNNTGGTKRFFGDDVNDFCLRNGCSTPW